MGIDKWIKEEKEKSKNAKKDKIERQDKDEEVLKKAKLKKIREIIHHQSPAPQKGGKKTGQTEYDDEFLNYVAGFKEWLNQRTYLKGDIDKLQIWIKNLYNKMQEPSERMIEDGLKERKAQLKEDFKLIPPDFVEEKIRIAVTKKLHGRKRNSSDNYYLRKLKKIIREKLKEAKYYKMLKEIIEVF
ncbi:MAG: hypothetical protein R6U96_06805 [Promethearchaeia archaeon]